MSLQRVLGFSFMLSLVLWAWLAWPLPRHLTTAIPSAVSLHKNTLQPMAPGDHLQYLYHCRLAQDMLIGRTPLFFNLYEFHTGGDLERFQPDTYYFPFSLLYAICAWLTGMACGWNLTGLIAFWGAALFTWLLARRYVSSDWIAAGASAAAIAMPFHWINLCGGSPAGLAMLWLPALWLGLDLAVHDNSMRGGLLAGLAILLASCTDQHIFFFGVLATPFWCLLALLARGAQPNAAAGARRPLAWSRLGLALLLPVLLTAIALLLPLAWQRLASLVTGLAPAPAPVKQRLLQEVISYSPTWQGFFGWRDLGLSNSIYFGYAGAAVILAGILVLAYRFSQAWQRYWRALLILTLSFIGILGIMALALGMHGPGQGILIKCCRFLIPPYGMVRQPAKIFCLMPSFLAVALALALAALLEGLNKPIWRVGIPMLAGLLIVAEYSSRIYPIVTSLDQDQPAYAAVAADIQANSSTASILVLPLWPGDSHYASLYQHFSLRYRIRMLNGYSPIVARDYYENVFQPLQSINQGCLSAAQLNDLQALNVGYILLHEDLFPEKVSPFPVAFTLQQLLKHPRLSLLKQAGPVWAFKIQPPAAAGAALAVPEWDIIGSARRWEAEACPGAASSIIADPLAGGAGYVALRQAGAWVGTKSIKTCWAPGLRWLARVRGDASFSSTLITAEQPAAALEGQLHSPEWSWLSIPIAPLEEFRTLALKLELLEGTLDIDSILLAAGNWASPAVGATLSVPAPCFFHAGYINLENNSVVLRKDHDPAALDFYGMKLPLERGLYQVEVVFSSAAPAGTRLGWFNIRRRDSDPLIYTAVNSCQPAVMEIFQDENLPLYLEFCFLRQADLEIQRVIFKRLR